MTRLYVPILNKDQADNSNGCLYEITCSKQESVYQNSKFNGFANTSVSFLNEKLRAYFLSNTFSFKIWNENQKGFKNFSERIKSISLGLFCSAYKVMNDKKFDEKYDSITVTGDFRVSNEKVQLIVVEDIRDKFELVKQYANYHSDKHHLFLYISSEVIVPEGLYENNLLVVRYDSKFPIECIFAEIFESINDNQQFYYKNKNEYVQTKIFLRLKKDFIKQQDCKGLIIKGESNTGKSIAANALCKYLQDCNQIDDYVWLTITDNRKFYKLLRDDISNIKFFDFQDKENIIKQSFSTEFNKFDDLLKQGKNCLFIIDNIESNYVDQILDFFKRYYEKYIEYFKLIITSWEGCNYRESKSFLNVREIDISEIALDKNEFEGVVNSLISSEDYKYKYQEVSHELQNKLIETLYKQCSKYPGYVPIALALLNSMSVNQIVEYFSSKNVKEVQPVIRLFQIAFMQMDIFSQMVLFAYLQLKNKEDTIFEEDAISILIDKIFNKNQFIDNHNIQQGIQAIKQHRFIEEVDANNFIIKRDVINYCVFSNDIAKELKLLRNTLITDESKVEYAIEYDKYDELTSLIDSVVNNKIFLSRCLMKCIDYRRNLKYIHLLLANGANPNYQDEDGYTPTLWAISFSNDVQIVKTLIQFGGKTNKITKNGYSSLMLAVDNDSEEIFNYIIEEKFYSSINYEDEDGGTALLWLCQNSTSIERFNKLIKYGANLKNSKGISVLDSSITNKSSIILDYILDKKIIDCNRETIFIAARYINSVGSFKKLYSLYKDIPDKDKNGLSLLMYSVINPQKEIFEYILMNNLYSDVNDLSNEGESVLFYAAREADDICIIEELIKAGARSDVGNTDLLIASAINPNPIIIQYVLENKLYEGVNCRDSVGWTPCHYAVKYNNLRNLELLEEYGADFNVSDKDGTTLLMIAAYENNFAATDYLIKKHKDYGIEKKDFYGKAALDYAIEKGNILLAHYLMLKKNN